MIHPRGSTPLYARDYLLDEGIDVPVVTDDWWLDLVSFANSNPVEDTFQSASGWGRWGFPLPPKSEDADDRGWRLAVAAMQRRWQEDADARPITQLSRPEDVHAFIARHPGLAQTCHAHLRYLIAYAPQLTIRGFGGEFEVEIEQVYRRQRRRSMRARAKGSVSGSSLTTDGRAPTVDEELALRDRNIGNYEPSSIACDWAIGAHVASASGPDVHYYEPVEQIAWLLSDESRWLPEHIRSFLTRGMAEWAMWHWDQHDGRLRAFGFKPSATTGALSDAMLRVRSARALKLTTAACADLEHRLSFSTRLLGLPESGEVLAQRMLAGGFIEAYFAARERRANSSGGNRRKSAAR